MSSFVPKAYTKLNPSSAGAVDEKSFDFPRPYCSVLLDDCSWAIRDQANEINNPAIESQAEKSAQDPSSLSDDDLSSIKSDIDTRSDRLKELNQEIEESIGRFSTTLDSELPVDKYRDDLYRKATVSWLESKRGESKTITDEKLTDLAAYKAILEAA